MEAMALGSTLMDFGPKYLNLGRQHGDEKFSKSQLQTESHIKANNWMFTGSPFDGRAFYELFGLI